MTVQQRLIQYKRLSINLRLIITLIILIGIFSYFWLPSYARSQLETSLSEILQRPVSIASFEIKPHTLELIVHGFNIAEKTDAREQSQTLFSFNRLHIDISMESLKRRVPIITAVNLINPKLRLVRNTANQLNISDLLELFSQLPDEGDSAPMQFSVSNITIQGGHFEFDDHYTKANHQITEINLSIPTIANFDSMLTEWIEPNFSARINESIFTIGGKIRPFGECQEATLNLKLSKFDLTQFNQYGFLPEGIKLLSGLYDSNFLLTFIQVPDKTPNITLAGNAMLQNLAIRNNSVESPYQANLKQLAVALIQVDLMGTKPSYIRLNMGQTILTRQGEDEPALSFVSAAIDQIAIHPIAHQVSLGEITLDRLSTTLRKDANGTIDLIQLFSPSNNPSITYSQAQAQTQSQAQAARIPVPTRKPVNSTSEIKKTEKENESHELAHANRKTLLAKNDQIIAHNQAKVQVARIPIPARKPISSISEIEKAEKENESHESAHVSREEVLATDASWTTKIKRIKLKAAKLKYEDLTLTKAAPLAVDKFDLTINDIDLKGIKPLNLELQALVNQHGRLKIHGSLAWAPLAINLTVGLDTVDLVSLQGWGGDKMTVLLTSGDISFDGKIKASGEPLKIHMSGDGKIANINMFDPEISEDLLRWKRLDISSLNFFNDPLRIDIKAISLDDFFAHMVILADGSLNLKHIVRQTESEKPPITSASTISFNTQPAKSEKSTPAYIDKIILQQGNINFIDQFIKPNYRVHLTGLAGQIGPLHPGKPGKIDIHGKAAKTAPLKIRGTINPFSSELSLDLLAQAKNIDLPPFSPYAGKYIGYEIEKGKLSADVKYQIEKGVLIANNEIFLDQFTLGDKVDSENAMSLPLELAIKLLRNRHGEINIHLPLKGSINDPQFKLGDIIFNAFVNLITKAVTSPFALLGSILEGDEQVYEVIFTPGLAEIDAYAAQRLQSLANILVDRPSLNLEIVGHADPTTDYEGLKLAELHDRVKTQKLAEQTKKGIASGSLADITLTTQEYSRYLGIIYRKEKSAKIKNWIDLVKNLPDVEKEKFILSNIHISDNDLAALAERRAIAARNWLVEKGQISDERIFVVGMPEPEESESKKGNRVEFLLK